MRAVAVLAVIAAHGSFGVIYGGVVGVEAFFVLSGYLITTLLVIEYQRDDRVSIRHFYLRRAARLLPALCLVTLLVLAVSVADPSIMATSTVLKAIPKVWLYVGNWFTAADPGSLGLLSPTWSLAIEEQFYLLWPLVLTFALARGIAFRGLTVSLLVLAVLSYAAFFVVGLRHGNAAYYSSVTRAGALLIGCGLALALEQQRLSSGIARGSAGKAIPAAVAAFAAAVLGLGYGRGIGLVLVALATPVVIAHIVFHTSPVTRGLSHPLPVWIGKRSYGLYLFHVPVFAVISGLGARVAGEGVGGKLVDFTVRMMATFVVAAASYRFVERPVLTRTRNLTVSPVVAVVSR